MAAKWIIYKKEFRIGVVSLHEDFLGPKQSDKEERAKVKGGGHFKLDQEEKKFELFGRSFDFGSCTVEDFEGIEWPDRWEGYSFYFTDDETGSRIKVK